MSDKLLSKTAWETEAKKHKLEDKTLSKALLAYEKCGEDDHAAQEEALKSVEKAAETLKKDKANKEIAGYLGSVLTACDKAQKALVKERETKEEGKDDDEGESAEYAKDLAKNLKIALGQVKGKAPGEPGATVEDAPKQLQFAAYLAGANCAVIVAKRIGGGVRKLAASLAGGSGGKHLRGECIYEKNAYTFVLDQPPGGLARKISAALLQETGTKYKVRVRSADGLTEFDDDETDAGGDAAPDTGAGKWAAALGELEPLFLKVTAAGHGDVSKFRAAVQMAQEKAEAGDFATALLVASRLLPRLREADAAGGPSEAQSSIPADVVPFVQARLSWISARAKLLEEMKKLETEIVNQIGDEEEWISYAANVSELTQRLAGFDAGLETTLEKMVVTPDGDARKALKTEAKAQIGAYAGFLKDPFFADIDTNNGFVNVAITSTARTALGSILAVLK